MPRFALCLSTAAALLAAGCSSSDEGGACYAPTTLDTGDICALLGDACVVSDAAPPALSPAIDVAPSPALHGVASQPAHNNLDVVWHQGRLFFAFRTAPSHFASFETTLYVVSSADQHSWVLEQRIQLDADLREPRLLSYRGRLFLYFAVLSGAPFTFEPQATMVSEYQGPCGWSTPEPVLDPGFIPWRARVVDDVAYLIGYSGGEGIYRPEENPVRVQWLTTSDGRSFAPVVPGHPVVLSGGSSETDFAFLDDGSVLAVSRNERGDEFGWGSKICRASAAALADWQCVGDPKKYDSPLLFRHGADVLMLARRNVTATGNYDLGQRELSAEAQTTSYLTNYWSTPKRCALWRVHSHNLSVEHLLDLPSNGDTCFPGLVPLGDGRYLIYNYTSPLDDLGLSWQAGQFLPTTIYRTTLVLP